MGNLCVIYLTRPTTSSTITMSVSCVRPPMGAMRQTVSRDVAAVINCRSRSFHVSARRLDDQSVSGSQASSNGPSPRRVRDANAASAIDSLQRQRAPPRTPGTGPPSSAASNGKILTLRKPLISRLPGVGAPRTAGGDKTNGNRAPGPLVRAPSQLRITRTTGTTGNSPGGGPGGRRTRPRGSGGDKSEPSARKRKPASAETPTEAGQDKSIESFVSDGLLQQLLRLQNKEWEKRPYEPKYAKDSFAANELIHAGRELFRGDAPDVKIWGRLEKKIGVVGMHGAEAALEVRRVVDENDTMLDEYDLPGEVLPLKESSGAGKKSTTAEKKSTTTKKSRTVEAMN
ncbi:unnamed protein product [Periconia digitata]|uniref:Uncharacterized protein n=1 Tax=Periconia digitata TaxID=1303443 RepID=A0A9W4XHI2_9PLEO|nr:unnamed protein product [Periconia digitata]